MSLFSKKEKVMLYTEQQKDDFIAKLQKANVKFDIHEDKDDIPSHRITYIISLKAKDMQKVV